MRPSGGDCAATRVLGRPIRRSLTPSHYRWPPHSPNVTHRLRKKPQRSTPEPFDTTAVAQTAAAQQAENYNPRYTQDTVSQVLFKAVQSVQAQGEDGPPNAPVLCSAFSAAWKDRRSVMWQHIKQALCFGEKGLPSGLDDVISAAMSPAALQWVLSKCVQMPPEQLIGWLAQLQSLDNEEGTSKPASQQPSRKNSSDNAARKDSPLLDPIELDVSELLHSLLIFVHDVQNPPPDPNAANEQAVPEPYVEPPDSPPGQWEPEVVHMSQPLSSVPRGSAVKWDVPLAGPYLRGSVGYEVKNDKKNWSRHAFDSNLSRIPRTAPVFALNPETNPETKERRNIGPGLYTEGFQELFANDVWGKHYVDRQKNDQTFYRSRVGRPAPKMSHAVHTGRGVVKKRVRKVVPDDGLDGEHTVTVQGLSVTCGGSVQGHVYRMIQQKAEFDAREKSAAALVQKQKDLQQGNVRRRSLRS